MNMGVIAILIVGLIVLIAVAWRKGWFGKKFENEIKAERDKLKKAIDDQKT